MIEKKGYVFIAELTNGATPIFGKPLTIEQIETGYENIITNEINLFQEEKRMRESLAKFSKEKRKEVKKIIPASLAMKIAENKEEIEYFRNLTDLVAIMIIKETNYTDMNIYGPINQDFMDLYQGVIPAHRVDLNGLLPFRRIKYGDKNFEVAMEARYQLQRQSDNTPTAIGTFKLTKLNQ